MIKGRPKELRTLRCPEFVVPVNVVRVGTEWCAAASRCLCGCHCHSSAVGAWTVYGVGQCWQISAPVLVCCCTGVRVCTWCLCGGQCGAQAG